MVTAMTDATSAPYRVLARKYRPTDFSAMIGQEAMVRTLSNAIASGRLAHAFVLTGVRGVGKTTTARIIARALNCVGPDGAGGPTISPCGQCEPCRAIAEDRHVDVMEMDAASRTGVDGIREIIDGVRYRPVSARYKVYIIDEVHMLSTAAFNALLKTLEEPPEHVKFIFATTELRKIPVTVLSRCQRFDLRRIEADTLAAYFQGIVKAENASVEDGAMKLIARAADGSARDGLSLLDQAISHGQGTVTESQVRDMLGLADRARVFDLFEAVMKGDVASALGLLTEQYQLGADPAVVLGDMLELTHWLTRLKLTPEAAQSFSVPEAERVRGAQWAEKLSMAHLARSWQMLLKGLGEVKTAPNPVQAAEMVLVRLAYVTDQPTPAETLEKLKSNPPSPPPGGGGMGGSGMGGRASSISSAMGADDGGRAEGAAALAVEPAMATLPPMPQSFSEVVALAVERREGILSTQLRHLVRLVRFAPGRIEFRLTDERQGQDLPQRLSRSLQEWTGRQWAVAINSLDPADPTLIEQEEQTERGRREDAANHPLVQAVLTAFPGAAISAVRDIAAAGDDDVGDDGVSPAAMETFEFEQMTGDDDL
jgi:DNA polymerase-3 subunit gamma/tau